MVAALLCGRMAGLSLTVLIIAVTLAMGMVITPSGLSPSYLRSNDSVVRFGSGRPLFAPCLSSLHRSTSPFHVLEGFPGTLCQGTFLTTLKS